MKLFSMILIGFIGLLFASIAAAVSIFDPSLLSATLDFGGFVSLATSAVIGLPEMRKQLSDLVKEAREIHTAAGENELTEDQQKRFNEIDTEIDALNARIEREEKLEAREKHLKEPLPPPAPVIKEESRGDIRVGKDRSERRTLAKHTLGLLNGVFSGNLDTAKTEQRELAKLGHYGAEAQQRAAGDYYSTLIGADGALLLPTVVANEIESIADVVGVARRLARIYEHIVGELRVPAATGGLTAAAVAEGGVIKSKMRQFKAVTLNPKKWALIVPWTYEINLEAGPQILQDAQEAIASGFARAEDDAMFNGDGSSAFNGVHGILSASRTGVGTYTMGSESTSFDDLSASDIVLLRRKIPASLRATGSYVFHPDVEAHLSDLRDGNGKLIYSFNETLQIDTLRGRPVLYTEVLPDISQDGVSKVFGVFGSFSFWKIASGQNMTAESMREATIEDADTGDPINLGTQDLQALKVRKLFDMDCNFDEAFCKIATAAS